MTFFVLKNGINRQRSEGINWLSSSLRALRLTNLIVCDWPKLFSKTISLCEGLFLILTVWSPLNAHPDTIHPLPVGELNSLRPAIPILVFRHGEWLNKQFYCLQKIRDLLCGEFPTNSCNILFDRASLCVHFVMWYICFDGLSAFATLLLWNLSALKVFAVLISQQIV